MKATILATTLLLGFAVAGTSQSAQAAPLTIADFSVAVSEQAVGDPLLHTVNGRRGNHHNAHRGHRNHSSNGFRRNRSFGHRSFGQRKFGSRGFGHRGFGQHRFGNRGFGHTGRDGHALSKKKRGFFGLFFGRH